MEGSGNEIYAYAYLFRMWPSTTEVVSSDIILAVSTPSPLLVHI